MADATICAAQIGRRLRQARTEIRLTQAQLANRMVASGHETWSQGTVSVTESGRRPLLVLELLSLTEILMIEIGEVLEGSTADSEDRLERGTSTLADARIKLVTTRAELADLRADINRVGELFDRVRSAVNRG